MESLEQTKDRSLLLLDHTGEPIGQLRWQPPGEIHATPHPPHSQADLDAFVDTLRKAPLPLYTGRTIRTSAVTSHLSLCTKIGATDPRFLDAVRENLHRYPFQDRLVLGRFIYSEKTNP